MLAALTGGSISTHTRRALVLALGWLDYRTVEPPIRQLLKASARASRRRRGGRHHCVDPGDVLAAAVDDPDPALRSRSRRAVGELKRGDLMNQVRVHLADDDEGCRFWAAWTSTLLGDRAGRTRLTEWLGRDDCSVRPPCSWYCARWIPRWPGMGPGDGERRRVAPECRDRCRGVGDPTSVPWLIGHMGSPALARLAGEAFSMITGVDLGQKDLDQPNPPEGEPDDLSLEDSPVVHDDSPLPWLRQELVDAGGRATATNSWREPVISQVSL